jgi:8-oxo-dGTP pyrophosphatase MutT (NUDIX family)
MGAVSPMSFLDRIAECNRHDPAAYVPFTVDGVVLGQVRRERIADLQKFPGLVADAARGVRFANEVTGRAARTAVMDEVGRALAERGLSERWRDEPYPVGPRFGEVWFEVERAIAEVIGVCAYGIHLNGYVRMGEDIGLWIPRRSLDRPTYPGKLDNTVAGGQPAALGIAENLAKEAWEEASIPPDLLTRAVPVGTLSYRLDGRFGLKHEVIFAYDLEMPADFIPENRDGEVEDFRLWPHQKAMAVVADTTDFKFNCALTLIDVFVRHGLIGPDHPDYVQICAGLRQ